MADWMIPLIVVGYFVVGAIFGGITVGISDDPDGVGLIVIFWPIFSASLIIGLFFYIPYKIGCWIGDRFH